MNPPTCPRCRRSEHVVRGFGGLRSSSWLCLSCYQRIRHLDRALVLWRLGLEREDEHVITVTRRAA